MVLPLASVMERIFTPSVIGILRHHITISIQDCNDIPLEVLPEGIPYAVVADGADASICIIGNSCQMVGSIVPGFVYQVA